MLKKENKTELGLCTYCKNSRNVIDLNKLKSPSLCSPNLTNILEDSDKGLKVIRKHRRRFFLTSH